MKYIVTIILLCLSFSANAEEFNGFVCSKDCSGHQAGYDWARDNIDRLKENINLCTTDSASFDAGCLLFLSDNLLEEIEYMKEDTLDENCGVENISESLLEEHCNDNFLQERVNDETCDSEDYEDDHLRGGYRYRH